ncbi:4082_t:CDS:2, partial [Scutellospora calospora]
MFTNQDQESITSSRIVPLLETPSSNPEKDQARIIIEPTFPPIIDTIELISKKSPDGRIPARAPNAFIIYRKVYVETAREKGHYLPMTIISSMASQSWESADETVKEEYRRIAKEALRVRNEMYPKSGRRKRKDRNINSNNKDTSPVIHDKSSFSTNSTSELPFNAYSPINVHIPFNPDLTSFSSESLYQDYLKDTDFNSDNVFYTNTHSPTSDIFTSPTSDIFISPTSDILTYMHSNSLYKMNCQPFDLNSVLNQDQTYFNVNEHLNLQFLNNYNYSFNDSYNENDEVTSLFAINQITANTPVIESNNYDMAQSLQFSINDSNITNSDAADDEGIKRIQ